MTDEDVEIDNDDEIGQLFDNPNAPPMPSHLKRHQILHKALDELIAEFIMHGGGKINESTVYNLMEWSAKQLDGPDHPIRSEG